VQTAVQASQNSALLVDQNVTLLIVNAAVTETGKWVPVVHLQ
jgi:hypothetical protein